jgi:hypothetical protein
MQVEIDEFLLLPFGELQYWSLPRFYIAFDDGIQ